MQMTHDGTCQDQVTAGHRLCNDFPSCFHDLVHHPGKSMRNSLKHNNTADPAMHKVVGIIRNVQHADQRIIATGK